MNSTSSPTVSLALLLALLAMVIGCGQAPRWNVVLVTFDTTRADHIGCYGDTEARTPVVDNLAATGVRFAHAYTAAPITAPSHSTILTGKYPIGHGFRDNGMFVLGDGQETLAEILRAEGYATAAAIGAFPLISKFGLDQGFDLYDDYLAGRWENFAGERVLPKARLFFDERPAGWVVQALLPWLEANHQQPFFLWAHFFDPHWPHEPPPPYDELFTNDLYRGEIAYSDESLGVLIDNLKRLGVYDRTIIVLAADHGEGQGEHGELTHSILLHDATMHVPLVIRTPEGAAGRVVDERVTTADILPTVLDLLGLTPPAGVQGISLAPWLEAGETLPPPAPRPIYIETLSPRLAFSWGELRGLYDGDYKYIFGPRPELYDMRHDPRELDDLNAAQPAVADRMQRQLARFLKENAAPDLADAVEMDDETRQRLLALGYLHSSASGDETIREELRPDGIPPQDRVGDISDSSRARNFLFQKKTLEAREICAELVARNPTNPTYLEMLARADLELGHFEDAIAALRRIRALYPEGTGGAKPLLQLAALYFYRGELERAAELARESVAIDASAPGYYLLANVFAAEERPAEARRALEQALAADPEFVPARLDLAVRQAQAGEEEAAAESFRQALAQQPYYAKVHYNYGTFLLNSQDLTSAERHFRRAVQLAPNYLQAHYALVAVNVALERKDIARQDLATLQGQAPDSPEAASARRLLEQG